MHIAGVVVQTRPERLAAVRNLLEALARVEVHAVNPDGRFVVTIEGDRRGAVADSLYRVNSLEGVLSACVVYEQSETEMTNVEATQ